VPKLARLAARHPRIALDVTFSDRFADVVKEGFDAAVRIGRLRDSTLVARPIAQQRLVVCASPVYLESAGRPTRPDALSGHRCLVFRMPSTGRVRPWEFVVGRQPHALAPRSTVTMNDGEALVAAAVAGFGLAQVPDLMAEGELRAGRLVEVLKAFRPPPLPIALVYPSSRQVTPRLRALIDALTGESASGALARGVRNG
jgi:DNA-binding transcriptional LysR family regulator